MPTYRIAGFDIFSQIELPIVNSIQASGDHPDLICFRARKGRTLATEILHGNTPPGVFLLSRIREKLGDVFLSTYDSRDQQAYYIFFNKIGLVFEISYDAKRVRVTSQTENGEELIPWFLLSQVLGFLMYLKGFVCLHASVVQDRHRTIGLLGTNGRGKSTLTAYLVRSGWHLVSDDLMCLENTDKLRLRPCFPLLKLRRDSIELLGLQQAPRIQIPMSDKMGVEVDGDWGRFTVEERPTLQAIYLIERDNLGELTNARITDVSCVYSEACLVGNGFGLGLIPPEKRWKHATSARTLATRIPVRRLRYPSGLAHLQMADEALLRDTSG